MQWDAHDDIDANHEKMCGLTDKPIAALLTDLKRTGLLDETLVVWGGEFGRTPVRQQGGRGRDHNATGFTMWMAGGGVKGGTIVGATDEIGLKAISDRAHVNDIHATILHLMGLDHTRLTFLHGGRDERLTDVAGRVLTGLLAVTSARRTAAQFGSAKVSARFPCRSREVKFLRTASGMSSREGEAPAEPRTRTARREPRPGMLQSCD